MKAETAEWVALAEADFKGAGTLMKSRAKLMPNLVGFHCQQCIEKYLKARLEEESLPVPKVHSLSALLGLLLPKEPLWASFNPSLLLLNNYAVKFRYPGHVATHADARDALNRNHSIGAPNSDSARSQEQPGTVAKPTLNAVRTGSPFGAGQHSFSNPAPSPRTRRIGVRRSVPTAWFRLKACRSIRGDVRLSLGLPKK